MEIVGPTLNILSDQTGVSLSGISTILVCRNGGYIIANIFGPLLENIVKNFPSGLLSISYLIASIGLF